MGSRFEDVILPMFMKADFMIFLKEQYSYENSDDELLTFKEVKIKYAKEYKEYKQIEAVNKL